MKFFSDLPLAFREGILEASTLGKKVRRWLTLGFFALAMLACAGTSVWAFSTGSIFPGIMFLLYVVTFGFVSITVIYTASSSEIFDRSFK